MSFDLAAYTALCVLYTALYLSAVCTATLPLRNIFRTVRAGGLAFSTVFAFLNARLDLMSGASAWTSQTIHTGAWTQVVLFLFYMYTYWCIYSVFRPRYHMVLFGVPLYEITN